MDRSALPHSATDTHIDDLTPLIDDWPGEHALAIADTTRVLGSAGDLTTAYPIASITKLFTTWAVLVAVEEGTLGLDAPAGPQGSTVRHLLAHASGLAFDDATELARPGERRIYSNRGIEVVADTLASAAGMPFAEYLHLGVLEPLGLGHLRLDGSPAHGLRASVGDLIVFAREVLTPRLLAPSTVAAATSPMFPDLRGVLPGYGVHDPNLWGLGFEIRGDKQPHWTGRSQHPATFGHFGGAGSFLWIDPTRQRIGATAGTVPFGDWAVNVWASTNEALLDRYDTAGDPA